MPGKDGTGQGLGGVRGPVKVFRGMPREWVYIAEEPGRLLLEFPPLLFYICRAMLKSRGTCRRSKVREDLTVLRHTLRVWFSLSIIPAWVVVSPL